MQDANNPIICIDNMIATHPHKRGCKKEEADWVPLKFAALPAV